MATMSDVLEVRHELHEKTEEMRSLADSDKQSDIEKFEQLKAEVKNLAQREQVAFKEAGLTDADFKPVPQYAPQHIGEPAKRTAGQTGPEYRSMFGEPQSRGGFDSFNEYLSVMASAKYEPRLEELRQMITGVGSEGGFLIPEGFAAQILDVALESEIVRPRARIWPMTTENLKIPGWNGFDHSGGDLYGGFGGAWLAEAGTATREYPELRQIELKAKKLAIYSQASRELIESGVNFEQQLFGAMAKSVSWHMDNAYISGNGVGRPLGILNSPGVVSVAPEPGQAAGTLLHENLANMFARLHPSLINNSVWLCNSTAIPQLLQLSIAVGVGGVHVPVLSDTGGQFKMLTRPVIFTEKVPQLGTEGDIILVDLSQYAVGLRREIFMDKSNAPGWLQDLQDYRTLVRVDGQGTWSDVFTPANGATQGWAVTIQDRA